MASEQGGPCATAVDAYNRRHLEAFLGCYAREAVIVDAVGTELIRGREAMHGVYGELFRDSPNLRAEITTVSAWASTSSTRSRS